MSEPENPPYWEAMPPPPAPPPSAVHPAYSHYAPRPGSIGQTRSTGQCILLFVVTLSIYQFYWFYKVHEEMKTYRNGQGLGGGIALLISIVAHAAMPYLTAHEIGEMYEARGQGKPVSAWTGLWFWPGIFLCFVGPVVWFVQVNAALNAYWRSLGAA